MRLNKAWFVYFLACMTVCKFQQNHILAASFIAVMAAS
jgi:hypothetical protein